MIPVSITQMSEAITRAFRNTMPKWEAMCLHSATEDAIIFRFHTSININRVLIGMGDDMWLKELNTKLEKRFTEENTFHEQNRVNNRIIIRQHKIRPPRWTSYVPQNGKG